jgi:C4-dicarboxylate-specific signal transduction histidine kinase
MVSPERMIGRSGLEFFGKMSAAISHDLKNVLAVVNENAGLLEDLCLMSEKGRAIDPARLKRLAADVKEQVRRGDTIAVRLNRFAHSVDDASMRVDLTELLELLAALAGRFAAAQGVAMEVRCPGQPVHAATWPFALLNLLWLCLEQAIAASGDNRQVVMTAEPAAAGARVRFSGLAGPPGKAPNLFPTEPQAAFCETLKASLQTDTPAGDITLTLPGGAGPTGR